MPSVKNKNKQLSANLIELLTLYFITFMGAN